jgi:hypothetical protein
MGNFDTDASDLNTLRKGEVTKKRVSRPAEA